MTSLFANVDAGEFLRTAFPQPNPYLSDPVAWVRDELGEAVWSKQALMMRSPLENDRTVVKAGHSVGKTRGLSRLVAWWVCNHPHADTLVVITSDNDDQIKGGIWRELIALDAKLKAEYEKTHPGEKPVGLPGNITLDGKWHAGPNNKQLVAIGRKPSDRNPTGLQGYHARYLLVIIEECCGVPEALWEAADSLASNEGGIVLACGNPTDPSSYMAEVCKPGSGWEVQQIRSIDTPEFTGEEVPAELEGVLASKSWVEKRRRAWGENSPTFIARILGEFPDVSNDSLIQPKWIEAAQKRSLERTGKPRLGIDIARMGEDETVVMRREGRWVRVHWAGHKMDTMQVVGHIIRIKREIDSEVGIKEFATLALDADGIGAGVYDRLTEQNHSVMPIHGGQPAIDTERFLNLRAEWYWNLRDAFEAGEIDIDPNDDLLAAQLGSLKWAMDSKGRIKIESKEDMRKRGMPSPDRADALAYSWAPNLDVSLDVGSHLGAGITADLMQMDW